MNTPLETEVTIERIVAGGMGLARTGDGVALVRGAMPGERVVALLEKRRGVLTGDVLDVLDASPDRDERPLPPGADLPLAYPAQLAVKDGIVADALRRARVEADLSPITPSPSPLGYRTAAQYAVTRDGMLAAREPGGRRPVPLGEDPLLSPPAAAAFARLQGAIPSAVSEVLIRASIHEGRALVGLVAGSGSRVRESEAALVGDAIAGVSRLPSRQAPDDGRVVAGAASLLEDFGGVLATVTPRSFAQVNPAAAGLLYTEAAAIAGRGDRAVDLYAGSGVLALHLAPSFREIVAVESSVDAVRRGEADRTRLGAGTLRFHAGDAAAVAEHVPADLVSVNPPRAGMAAEVAAALVEHAPPRILYVSCDPPTWARDVARLTAGGYRVAFARPYDFYPYTHHVEMLSLLERT